MEKPICRSCGADIIKQEIRANFVFGGKSDHKFWQCKECDLVYLWPVPTEEEDAHFYAKEFEKYMSSRVADGRDWSGPKAHIKSNQDHVKRRWKFLENDLAPGKDILEIGCSSGFMMDAFKQAGLNPVGIEPSQVFLDFLKKSGHTAFASLDELKKETDNKKFDLILHFFVLEHIRDTESFFREQIELLKPNGKIISEVPCVNDPLTSFYKIPAFEQFYWSVAHHYYFSPKSLSYILNKLGCEYELLPEQRYDLSNHLVWLQEGKPGGQGRYNHIFSESTVKSYKKDLIRSWHCDTMFVVLKKHRHFKIS